MIGDCIKQPKVFTPSFDCFVLVINVRKLDLVTTGIRNNHVVIYFDHSSSPSTSAIQAVQIHA